MKKILYLIPIFIFILMISPNKVFAAKYYNELILKELPITDEQKEEYLNLIFNSDKFKEYSFKYPYYLIGYQEKGSYLFSTNYTNNINVAFYEEIPTFDFNKAYGYAFSIKTSSSYSITYNINNNFTVIENLSIGNPKFSILTGQVQDDNGDYHTKYDFNINYVLATNLNFRFGMEMPLYDSNMNLLKTYASDENIFESLNLKPKEDLTIESIEKADNTLYNLSVELLGELPEEFTFLYSICQLFLGIVIILVVLSPIILLLRLFR